MHPENSVAPTAPSKTIKSPRSKELPYDEKFEDKKVLRCFEVVLKGQRRLDTFKSQVCEDERHGGRLILENVSLNFLPLQPKYVCCVQLLLCVSSVLPSLRLSQSSGDQLQKFPLR